MTAAKADSKRLALPALAIGCGIMLALGSVEPSAASNEPSAASNEPSAASNEPSAFSNEPSASPETARVNTTDTIAEAELSDTGMTSAHPSEKGLAIARAANTADEGFGDTTALLTMLLQISSDEEVTREMRQLTLEVQDDGDKGILVFDRPRDLKGTAILTYTHRQGVDDQWLYLPALKRVKRISSADKSGPFMGSEFAYEDLASQEVEKYTYQYVRDEILNGTPCFVVERIPVDAKSGYARQIAWYDQSEYRLQQVQYYDRKNALLKTMSMKGYKQYLDRYWRPDEMHMSNHQTERSTILKFENYQFRTGLDDNDFNRNALSRMR